MSRREYPRDVSDDEWAILEPLIPPAKPGGHPQTTDRREVIKALFSPLPHRRPMASFTARLSALVHRLELLPSLSQVNSTWEHIHTALRERGRIQQGREPTPSAAIIDSQSVKTSQKGGRAATTAALGDQSLVGRCSPPSWHPFPAHCTDYSRVGFSGMLDHFPEKFGMTHIPVRSA